LSNLAARSYLNACADIPFYGPPRFLFPTVSSS
jgi:hypothetical protein